MRDARIGRACPFCGEAHHLSAGGSITRPVIRGGAVALAPTGEEITEEVDAAWCQVCEAMAPLDVWNGQRSASDYAALRDFDPEPQQVAA